jgi:hypothetical protein
VGISVVGTVKMRFVPFEETVETVPLPKLTVLSVGLKPDPTRVTGVPGRPVEGDNDRIVNEVGPAGP